MFNFIEKIKKIKLPFFTSFQTSFDLGTVNTRVGIKDKGCVTRESSAIGFNSRVKEYAFWGDEAKSIVGKTPEFLKIIKPVINGVISDFDAEVSLIKKFIEKSLYPYFFNYKLIKPNIIALASVPTIATEIEQKATEEVLLKAGLSKVFLIEKPLATTTGCGFDIFSHTPCLIVDMGGGLIEASIISGGGIVVQKTLKNAGEHMNKLIYNYIHLKYGVILGESTCEELKISLLNFEDKEKTATVRGKSLETGLPKSVRVKTGDIREALMGNFNQITDMMKELIELSPPETIDDLLKRGVVLTGGLANVKGIDNFFASEIKIDVYTATHPSDTTINGLLKLMKQPEIVAKIKI